MSRWYLLTLLLFGSVCLFFTPSLMPAAHAQGIDAPPPVLTPAPGDTTTPAPPAGETTPGTTTAPATSETPSPAGTNTQASGKFPSKSAIHDALAEGHPVDAESAYLAWVSYWGEDDPTLLISVEHEVLLQQFRAGKFAALIAMVKAGDPEATSVLKSLVVSGRGKLPVADFAAAIRMLGQSQDKELLNTLRLTLYSEDKEVVNAAIEALGNLGDMRVVPELMRMFEKADVERAVCLARALTKLGAAKELQKRYLPQLHFPLPGASEKAALILGATGNPTGWAVINKIMTEKEPTYYPLVLTILSALPSAESQAWVAQGLAGSEQEQLAALKSISVFPVQRKQAYLLQLSRDAKATIGVRVAAIDALGETRTDRALKELRTAALRWEPSDPSKESPARDPEQVKAEAKVTGAAILSLQKWGMFKDNEFRKFFRIRIDEEKWDENVVLAARTAMLRFALEARAGL